MTDDLDRSPIRILGTESPVYRQVPLARMTTLRVGGPAQWYVTPRHLDDLHAAVSWANSEGFPITLLGAGSNLLIGDKGVPGLVVCTRYLRETTFAEDGRVRVAAGVPLPKLAWQIADRGWSGFEWAVGIPGTVGGAVVMNAGAHRNCTADVVERVEVLSPGGSLETLSSGDLQYSYRHSVLQGSDRTVVSATFTLEVGDDPQQVKTRTETHLKQRHASQPYHRPSCGSVFRNPTPQAAGWLIEQSGLKGYSVGGACVAREHANFILNCGQASADDVVSVIRHVRQTVFDRWNVWLEPEVKFLGEFSRSLEDLW
ncbi:UDP-N-acetylmuramate dehydrogenase [Baaleninema sp.]|uniref:UDP-N-acetylmuramate dehydrogenase n=1 Tax=Baaleninema sp. TaxID=3101197 RepID=UPI003D037A41